MKAKKWNPEYLEFEPYKTPEGAGLYGSRKSLSHLYCAACGLVIVDPGVNACPSQRIVTPNKYLEFAICATCFAKDRQEAYDKYRTRKEK